jgi:hypothetical protein
MNDTRETSGLNDALKGIQRQLTSIQKTLKSFEQRIGSLEVAVDQRLQPQRDNPLIFSRVLMGTLDKIKEYEEEHGHGIVAKDLARIRGVEPPTIYDHLSKLEEADLIFWQRGTELGLKPYNAKFYSVAMREEGLEDIPVMMSLPDFVIPVAQAILNASEEGVSRGELLEMVQGLKEGGEEPWSETPPKEIESTLDEALKILLRRVLVEHRQTIDRDYYYPRS